MGAFPQSVAAVWLAVNTGDGGKEIGLEVILKKQVEVIRASHATALTPEEWVPPAFP